MRISIIGLIVTLALGLLITPLRAKVQEVGKAYRVGFLFDSPTVFPDAIEAFRQGLRDLGYVEGQNPSGSGDTASRIEEKKLSKKGPDNSGSIEGKKRHFTTRRARGAMTMGSANTHGGEGGASGI